MKNSIIENIKLDNIQLTINKGKYSESYGGNFDLRPASPINIAIFKHDIPGIYAQYVKNLKISDFEMNWGTDLPSFFTHAIEIRNFQDILLERITANPSPVSRDLSAINLYNGVNAVLRDCNTKNGSGLLSKEKVK